MAIVKSHILGLPRIGVDRRMKTAVEAYWKGSMNHEKLLEIGQQIQLDNIKMQSQANLSLITVGDFCWYDHVLDMSMALGVVPSRFVEVSGQQPIDSLNTMFCMARGRAPDTRPAAACEMTKWFNTNYHYIVPEITNNQRFTLNPNKWIQAIDLAIKQGHSGDVVKPVLLGPVTYLQLSKVKGDASFDKWSLLPTLLDVYVQLIGLMASKGVKWVQLDEPWLTLDVDQTLFDHYEKAYKKLASCQSTTKILLATYFSAFDDQACQFLLNRLPVHAVHIDLCVDPDHVTRFLGHIKRSNVTTSSSDLIVSLGLINGRNVWKADMNRCLTVLAECQRCLSNDRLWIGTSCSLLHCPVDLDAENRQKLSIFQWLSFAKQKCYEVALLARCVNERSQEDSKLLMENERCLESRRTSNQIHNDDVKKRVESITDQMAQRQNVYSIRSIAQKNKFKLPYFPTTTIGSFPQTDDIRALRNALKTGKITIDQYETNIKKHIEHTVRREEELQLDVLVHGEPERNDMVEYFGELLNGFTFTGNGWVQSYGSRCVKPPIIFGDVFRPVPMTVRWSSYAQSLTCKFMKGMLTGPVTMLSWSFVRDDQPLHITSLQLALALRDEIVDLQNNGICIIQLDEPAFREALPLRRNGWSEYLRWSIRSFRVATGGVRDDTQIHTHMCYSEFNDIIQSIAQLDADVITIESSRSDMELLSAFDHFQYPNEIGPGVYDIHSPNVPTVEEIVDKMEKALQYIPAERLWINPDCGLKTRQWTETDQALSNMVQAAKVLRQKYGKKIQ